MTRHTAVFGSPIAHSLSPLLHNDLYEKEAIDAHMEAYKIDDVSGVIAMIREKNIELSAITIPHKQTILPLLDSVENMARTIGAVNTVILKDGTLHGYNTDVIGIEASLDGVVLHEKKVLIIGAGGAAQPVAYFLAKQGADIYCMNRTFNTAAELCKKYSGSPIADYDIDYHSFDLIINTTAVGMADRVAKSPVPKSIIRPDTVVFDVVYTPLETTLLKEAREIGARTISGLTMFIAQALAQEQWWLGREFEDKNYSELLITNLSARS